MLDPLRNIIYIVSKGRRKKTAELQLCLTIFILAQKHNVMRLIEI